MGIRWIISLALSSLIASGAMGAGQGSDLELLLQTISVSGREEHAAAQVLARLPEGSGELDRLGNVVVTLGEGSPRRLVACGLDEPGLVVSEIRQDGYLRVRPTGGGARGALWTQAYEGQKVWISTGSGRVAGAVAIPSIHLEQDSPSSNDVFTAADVWVDVGADTAAEVRSQGIELLDPIGLYHRVTAYGAGLLAGPAAQSKAACAALLAATRRLTAGSVDGSLIIAWLRLERWNRKGIEYLVRELGPFDEVLLASRGFGWARQDEGLSALETPLPGSGPLSAGDMLLPGASTGVAHLEPGQAWFTRGPDWGDARVGYFAVPAAYRDTPVETVVAADVDALAERIVEWAVRGGAVELTDRISPREVAQPPAGGHEDSSSVLAQLISAYGVSTREEGVRQAVRGLLPGWAEPRVDRRGNLLVQFGGGEEHVAFVAHLDEVGFTVEEILADGRLRVAIRGGLTPSAWEAQSAIVHTAKGPVRGVFEPRADWLEADSRRPPDPLTVFLGTVSAVATAAAGVEVGDAVTMPKFMLRLGRHRAVARSFDDRVGSTAQLLALARIDPSAVERLYTFAWVVEEEIGLFGSVALAADLDDLDRIHPIDTFVSSDDPYPDKGFALAPLGEGVVLRAMDNGYFADRWVVDYVRSVAERHGIPTQIGFTGGSNDGIAFMQTGATNLPLSWPGRFSHSPAEVMDLRDLESLIDLIVALVED